MELYGRVRYAVQIEGLSRREAARRFGCLVRTAATVLKGVHYQGILGLSFLQVELLEVDRARRDLIGETP